MTDDELSKTINETCEALAKWLAIKLSEKSFRGKKWTFYKEEVEPRQMTIFEFLEG